MAGVWTMLADAAKMDDWLFVDGIDVPLRQRALSCKINKACNDSLLATAPNTRSRALALSIAISHAGDWLSVVPLRPWASIFTARNPFSALSIDWASGFWKVNMDVHFAKVRRWRTPWVTIKWVVAGTGLHP